MSSESNLSSPAGRFQKGRSGNPKGRPKGARNKTTVIAQNLLDRQAQALIKKVVRMALGGDLTCLRLCLERLVPPKKDAPIDIELSRIAVAGDIPKLFSALSARLGEGGLTIQEARSLIEMTEDARRLYELTELEQRISALEKKPQ